VGKAIDEENAERAGNSVISDAEPLSDNRYMVQIAKTLVKRTVLACK
jgi:xanthine dehydrogenase YagS FAD-binding subunit